jgi:hypothetical protein
VNPQRPSHITDDDLEAYSLEKPQLGTKRAEIEEHLLVCAMCRARMEDMDAYVETMKASLRLLDARDRQRNSEE